MSKITIHVYRFSSSSGTKTYETLLLSDGSTTCDCPGWTRRCVDGQRTCKHVRVVEGGAAGLQWLPPVEDYQVGSGKVTVDVTTLKTTTKPKPPEPGTQVELPTGGRKFL